VILNVSNTKSDLGANS